MAPLHFDDFQTVINEDGTETVSVMYWVRRDCFPPDSMNNATGLDFQLPIVILFIPTDRPNDRSYRHVLGVPVVFRFTQGTNQVRLLRQWFGPDLLAYDAVDIQVLRDENDYDA